MSMDSWKKGKQIKKAKKSAIKSLTKEGSSLRLAKILVDKAYKRIKDENN